VIADLIGKLLNTTEDLMFNKSFGQLLVFGFAVSLPISLAMAADKTAPKTDKLSSADEKFVKEAAAGGMMEVELGKLAVDKSANDKVKAFGRQMQEDHGKANEELKTLAANKGVKIPNALEGKQKRTVDRLSKLSGAEFDRQYMRTMIEDHKEDLKAFEREADKAKDSDVKQFASKFAPVIKKHLDMAQTTGEQLKVASKPAR
jgi:putative membrane protein